MPSMTMYKIVLLFSQHHYETILIIYLRLFPHVDVSSVISSSDSDYDKNNNNNGNDR